MGETRQVEVDGKELRLSNLDKVLYPKAGFTKGEMVDYYAKLAPAIVPHLSGRAVTLRRFPEGVDDLDAAFFEKRCPKHRPQWVKTTSVRAGPNAGKIDFCVCDGRPTLVWMAQLAAVGNHLEFALWRVKLELDAGMRDFVQEQCLTGDVVDILLAKHGLGHAREARKFVNHAA